LIICTSFIFDKLLNGWKESRGDEVRVALELKVLEVKSGLGEDSYVVIWIDPAEFLELPVLVFLFIVHFGYLGEYRNKPTSLRPVSAALKIDYQVLNGNWLIVALEHLPVNFWMGNLEKVVWVWL